MMMLEREVSFPVDVIQPSEESEEIENKDYAEQLQGKMYDAHERGRNKLNLSCDR